MYQIGEEELLAVKRVFDSGRLFRYQAGGGECDAFEREFADKFQAGHALILTSGTNALFAALRSLNVHPGDEVIVPAYTFVATPAAVLMAGATPVIADVDSELGLDPEDLRRKISERTKAIIPVHMDGLAANLDSLLSIAREKGLHVIEDAAQAMGGSYQGRRLGTLGDFGCFSLNENKNISCGEGGVLVTHRRDHYERAFCLQDVSAQFSPARKDTFREITPFVGASMRVSEISGAIMRVQLGRLDGILAQLRTRKRALTEALASVQGVRIIRGHCVDGDCASALHLAFEDPMAALEIGRSLRSQGVLLAPVTMRPAHVAWKWGTVLPVNSADHVQSVSLLSRVLKLDIDPRWSMDEVSKIAERIEATILKPGGALG